MALNREIEIQSLKIEQKTVKWLYKFGPPLKAQSFRPNKHILSISEKGMKLSKSVDWSL